MNSVPHMNVIGTTTRAENMFSFCVLLVSMPARRPSMENVRAAKKTTTSAIGSMLTAGDIRWPTMISTVQLSSARITPEAHFPRMIDEMCTGHSRSSSKLM